MKIKYYGNSCYLVKSKTTKLITNPKDKGVRAYLKKVAPDIVVLSHKSNVDENDYYVISTPGEYEIKDVFVYGYLSDISRGNQKQSDIYMIDVENVHLGFIDKEVTKVRESILSEMGIVNVLFVSLDTAAGMDTSKVIDLVNKVDPKIVIPMDYTKETLERFAKVLGVKEIEKEKTLDVKGSDCLDDDVPIRFIVLEK